MARGEMRGLRKSGYHGDQEQVDRELGELRGRDRSAHHRLAAHRPEQRAHLRGRRRLAGQHPDKLCGLGRLARARNGRLHIAASGGADLGFEPERSLGRSRSHVDDGVPGDSGLEVRRTAAKHRVDRRVVEQHEENDARLREHLRGALRNPRARGAQRLAAGGGPVPDHQRRSRPRQIERHGLPHDPETDKADIHVKSFRQTLACPKR